MTTVALIAASIAALVLAAVGVRVYSLVKRLHQLADQVGDVIESSVGPAVKAVGDTARGAQSAVGKLDDGMESLANALGRVDRLTAHMEADSVARTVVQPIVGKLLAWVSGLRKGMKSARGERGEKTEAGEGAETEAG